ncbi:hypothetical protein ZHAS_00015338 [Anopheles sinensis]|uniref:Uncharacterized protein n=1 Tax=Anopheles sinensis TaxID=74873 RepID=A0A084WAR3_ANOSI|nr:hypothetical protein ZHAS_00015338 [Anopheles sinensis]
MASSIDDESPDFGYNSLQFIARRDGGSAKTSRQHVVYKLDALSTETYNLRAIGEEVLAYTHSALTLA